MTVVKGEFLILPNAPEINNFLSAVLYASSARPIQNALILERPNFNPFTVSDYFHTEGFQQLSLLIEICAR